MNVIGVISSRKDLEEDGKKRGVWAGSGRFDGIPSGL